MAVDRGELISGIVLPERYCFVPAAPHFGFNDDD